MSEVVLKILPVVLLRDRKGVVCLDRFSSDRSLSRKLLGSGEGRWERIREAKESFEAILFSVGSVGRSADGSGGGFAGVILGGGVAGRGREGCEVI